MTVAVAIVFVFLLVF